MTHVFKNASAVMGLKGGAGHYIPIEGIGFLVQTSITYFSVSKYYGQSFQQFY